MVLVSAIEDAHVRPPLMPVKHVGQQRGLSTIFGRRQSETAHDFWRQSQLGLERHFIGQQAATGPRIPNPERRSIG